MMARRQALDGSVPERVVRTKTFSLRCTSTRRRSTARSPTFAGTGEKVQASTTTAFARLLRNLLRDPDIGARVVPIIPDEARTFGLDALFRDVQDLRAVRAALRARRRRAAARRTARRRTAASSRRGSPRPASMASFTAAGTAYATWGQPMIPFFIFYSMFGFQRVGDLIWAFGDQRGRGFLLGATAGRTTLTGEGLQHCDGQSQLLASAVPELPGVRPGVRVRDGGDRPRRHRAHVRARARGLLLLPHPLQRELRDAGDARGRRGRHRARPVPLPAVGGGGRERRQAARRSSAAAPRCSPRSRRSRCSPTTTTSPPTCGARRATSCCARTR